MVKAFGIRSMIQTLFVGSLVLLFLRIPGEGQYRFDSWTTDNGLPQASINAILQTRDGFLWFSTYGGLVRYDGLRFHVFSTANTEGLRTSRLQGMFEDTNGNLWIRTEGQGITRYKDGTFTSYTIENGLPHNQISYIWEDADGNLLMDVESGQQVQWKDGAFTPHIPPAGEPTKEILFRTSSGGIWYRDGSHIRKYENGNITEDFASKFRIVRVFEDSKGRAWLAGYEIAGRGNVLAMLKDGKLTTYENELRKEGYPEFRYSTVLEDRQGRIWFGARSGGFAVFQDDKFKRYTAEDGLVGNDVTNIYQDREGTIWVGTTIGLSRLSERTITSYSQKDGIAADNVYPIYQDRSGKIWIGSWKGLTVYENGVFHNVSDEYSLASELVSSLFEDNEGSLWIGTWGGVRRMKEGKLTIYPLENTGMRVRAITQDRNGNLWFGSSDGLIKFKDETFTKYTVKDGLLGKEIPIIHEDRSGQLWVGTDTGLTKYKDGVFTAFTEKDGISSSIVRAIYEDPDGVLWIGMYDRGLYRYKDGRFSHYSTQEGLFDNGVFQIIEDGQGNFWISCNLGIYRVKKSELNDYANGRVQKIVAIPYTKRDGMINSECNGGAQPAGIKTVDGQVWFPTQGGVAVINPAAVPFNNEPPPVVIESLILDTKPVDVRSTINISPEQTNLEIHYSGLSFINPELVKFKYRLDGLDDDWIDAATRRTAFYSHLAPGTYTFTVLAANRDGVWNEKGASIKITVLPPFWRTWWFMGLLVFTVGGLAYTFYHQRMTQLKKERYAQQAFSQQLIESQERERERIAGELHDGLGQDLLLIKNWALLGLNGLKKDDKVKKELEAISASVSHAIDETRGIAHNLRPIHLDTIGLTKSLIGMIESVGESSGVPITADICPLDKHLLKDAEINIYRIVQECLNNIVKHSHANKAAVNIETRNGILKIAVHDDGVGFAADDSAVKKSGFGLKNIAERVNMLGGEHSIQSAPGQGTSILITIDWKRLRGTK